MRKTTWFVAAVALAVLLAACAPAQATPVAGGGGTAGMPNLEGRQVTVAVENAYLPFNYIDPDSGQPAGWDYEVWDEICRRLNCVPVYTEAAWEGMIQAVSDGQFDAAADGITITEERAQIVDFSMGYIAIEQRLLVRFEENAHQQHPRHRRQSRPEARNPDGNDQL